MFFDADSTEWFAYGWKLLELDSYAFPLWHRSLKSFLKKKNILTLLAQPSWFKSKVLHLTSGS